ncbi:hypothetical protein COCVIDRAFT_83310 [Bipolaris victoriae FI3]|uniref:Uncharacterized protein n=2 Tax=Bipolaris TaxID=33194 RepID=W6Y819_COCC2|nr:uncharacterized protein COCCADRAFT_94340 [Bipolaris zeicola 26-R-13]XP_014562671.1 hypothetical protein COCVIDRAFT_83310 [Bipolaris victoriae FI3]EUC34103.1 hypothetical protein COCCADRAFT_94340 [Bipolaris zeicola 26-R-13]
MAWTAHAPGPAGPRWPAKVPHSHLILQRQPLTTRARQHCTRRDRVPGPPLPLAGLVIDHRIMLDVESVPGPSLLSSFGPSQEQSVSWRGPITVHAWSLCPCGNRTRRTGFLEGTYCPTLLMPSALRHKYHIIHSRPQQ